ncbi:MAG TPA: hypothetical protein VE713_02275 [Pyrinomonadaceae bacterium]|jgi:hypothetical protein|nr:hypothetical protein [Pyrinomonadaceae bacterium]
MKKAVAISEIFEKKAERRRRLARLSFEEKIEIVQRLQKLSRAIKESRDDDVRACRARKQAER